MEPMDGTQGLEKKRLTQPAISSDQSTSVNAQKPWTFNLGSILSIEDGGVEKNPRLTIEFKTEVTVNGVRLQGNTNGNFKIGIILLAQRRLDGEFVIVKKASGEVLVSEAFLSIDSPYSN